MLSVTNFLSQNVAPIPFLWILPLSCYLLTSIICFGAENWYRPVAYYRILLPMLAVLGYVALHDSDWPLKIVIPLVLAALFVACMFCHGELVRLKPGPLHLTSFYFAMSLGGAVGGIFVGLAAPAMYVNYAELPVSIIACLFLALALRRGLSAQRLAVSGTMTAALSIGLALLPRLDGPAAQLTRNFYGSLHINEGDTQTGRMRRMFHGDTIHGAQFISGLLRREPATYYGRASAIGLILGGAVQRPRRVGIVGLGTGTLAAYAQPGDTFRSYEINPLVSQLADTRFSFLRDCRGRCEVILGDGRLSLAREPAQNYDVLVLDAFSGDSIPVHLLTVQAFHEYFRHLRTGGILAIHISNRYLDIAPVVASACEPMNRIVRVVVSAADKKLGTETAIWTVVAEDGGLFRNALWQHARRCSRRVRPWTDDYSNLLRILVR